MMKFIYLAIIPAIESIGSPTNGKTRFTTNPKTEIYKASDTAKEIKMLVITERVEKYPKVSIVVGRVKSNAESDTTTGVTIPKRMFGRPFSFK